MNNDVEYLFEMDGKKYKVVRTGNVLQRTYVLNVPQGFPWLRYSGSKGVCGDGIVDRSLYSVPDTLGRQYLFSTGPWWVDANHSNPGYGYLSLVFFCHLQLDKRAIFDPNLCYPNMHGMKIRGKIRGHNVDLKGSDLVFWFQCYSEKIAKNVNYALIGQPLNDKLMDGNINEFELNVDIDHYDDWICLGSCHEKRDRYGDLDIRELDLDKPSSMGFILVPIDVKPIWPDECNFRTSMPMNLYAELDWPIDTRSIPTGIIALYELEIDYHSEYQVWQME
jgi:hypothetical protein